MISRELVETFFSGFSIERWNDKLRPIPLLQMDKHAHKLIIAWIIGKYEEKNGNYVNWNDIIRGGIFELLRRIIISDIQSPVFREISKNGKLVAKLNYMIFKELESKFRNESIKNEFYLYLTEKDYLDSFSQKILNAGHKYSSWWEFQLIRYANPEGYGIQDIELEMGNDLEQFSDLEGIRKLRKKHNIKNFVDLCGELRYQIRWGHLPRIPRTSVLGHSMLVACLSFFFTRDIENPCPKRMYNNFFIGLFHDLPEVVTRDIIKPIKRSVPGMQEEIKRIERELAEREIHPHLEPEWVNEIKYFTQDEFITKITLDGTITNVLSDDISAKYNQDKFSPSDGTLVKAADDFSAFLEAYSSAYYGINSAELDMAMKSIKSSYENSIIAGVDVGSLFREF